MEERQPAYLVKNKGKWYAQITIPPEDRKYLNNRRQLKLSTGTADKRIAERRLHDKAAELYTNLDSAKPDRIAEVKARLDKLIGEPVNVSDMSGEEVFEHQDRRSFEIAELQATLDHAEITSLKLSEVTDRFLKAKPYAKHKTQREAETYIADFVKETGNPVISDITKQTAYKYAEKLGATKSNKTVRKRIGYVSKALSWAERQGLSETNSLDGLKLSEYGKKTTHREPLSSSELEGLFAIGDMPIHIRCLLSILLTTGMRLDEAALLDWSDLKEEGCVRYFDLTHRDQTTKNIGSRRKVPVPTIVESIIDDYMESLGVKAAAFATRGIGQVFPQFKRNADLKAQGPASKACMPFIREVTKSPSKVVHSLRGNFKDKMRDVGVPNDIHDFITGHGSGDVAGKYGQGPSIAVRAEAINRVDWRTVGL